MSVTVCIPAYRAGGFIAQTVAAVLAQTHTDLRLVVGIDPPDDGSDDTTAAALAAFAHDRRLSFHVNARRLGWAENTHSLLAHVTTPYYVFLPHDDIWCPIYLETMVSALEARPDAVVAYGDLLRFGASPPIRKSVRLPAGEDRATHLLRFLIQGTDAQMWRGVTRSAVLERIGGFPSDRHKGFVVECEYSLALHGVGAAVQVPRTLYFKRTYAQTVVSASSERVLQPLEERAAGWAEHDRRMARLLAAGLADMQVAPARTPLFHAAKDAAVIRRYQQFVHKTLEPDQKARVDRALQVCSAADHPFAPEVAANLHLVLQWHWQSLGEKARAGDHARQAWEICPVSAPAVLEQARALAATGRHLEALERAAEVMRLSHFDDTQNAQQLIAQLYRKLGWVE